MKLMISKYNTVAKYIIIVSGFVCVINAIITLFARTLIPGLGPFALGIFLFGLSIMELNNYKLAKDKLSQILGWTYIVLFGLNFYIGISQLNYFFY